MKAGIIVASLIVSVAIGLGIWYWNAGGIGQQASVQPRGGAFGAPARPANGGQRVALVIGNGAYDAQTGWSVLSNPPRDADSVARVLRDLGFEHVLLYKDLDRTAMFNALDRFEQALAPGDTAFFFYSGHGAQLGDNYLIPISAGQPTSERSLRSEGLAVQEVLSVLRNKRTGLNVVVLDACRDNPLSQGSKGFGGAGLKGIERTALSGETLIAFAAAPNRPARDGSGRLSPFTAALVEELAHPQHLWKLFGAVSRRVKASTEGQQVPWKNDNLTDERYLVAQGPRTDDSGSIEPAHDAAARRLTPEAREHELGLTRDERRKVQIALSTLGLGVGETDGIWGSKTREGIGKWQSSVGKSPTGYLDAAGYKALLAAADEAGRTLGRQTFRDRLSDGSEGPVMMVIPAGSFKMGSNAGDGDEKPVHRVGISKAFAMGKYEVTVGEFRWFAHETGYKSDAEKGDGCYVYDGSGWSQSAEASWRNPGMDQQDTHPVVCVSWNDASTYAQWLSQQTGHDYRLPSEAEWEYAARAGTSTAYGWGDASSRDYANYGTDYCCAGHTEGADRWIDTAPVGSFPANPFGLHDTAGNVWEWIFDWYDGDAYASHSATDPVVRQGGSNRVIRGGSWDSPPRFLRSAFRYSSSPDHSGVRLGFRLARTL